VEDNVVHHTSFRLPWTLYVDDHLWRAPASLVRVSDCEPHVEGDCSRVDRPGHQLEHISGILPYGVLLNEVQRARSSMIASAKDSDQRCSGSPSRHR
jgi:hypothetical protein